MASKKNNTENAMKSTNWMDNLGKVSVVNGQVHKAETTLQTIIDDHIRRGNGRAKIYEVRQAASAAGLETGKAFDLAILALWRAGKVAPVVISDYRDSTPAGLAGSIQGVNEEFYYLESC